MCMHACMCACARLCVCVCVCVCACVLIPIALSSVLSSGVWGGCGECVWGRVQDICSAAAGIAPSVVEPRRPAAQQPSTPA